MPSIDDEMDGMMDAVLDAFGASIVVTRVTAGAMDAATGTRAATAATMTINANKLKGERALGSDGRWVETRRYSVKAGDCTFVPVDGDKVTEGGVTRHITRVDHECVGSTARAYMIWCVERRTAGT